MNRTRRALATVSLLVVIALVVPSMVLSAPSMAAEWTYVVNARLGLRMHAEAGLLSKITLVLYNGEDVRVEGDPAYADGLWWSQVRVERRAGEFVGWVASAHLANYEEAEDSEGPESGPVYVVTARLGLNLRSSAGLRGVVLHTVPTGTRLVATDAAVRQVDGLTWREFALADETVWAAEPFVAAE
jgi:uncharacterized protein YgiM (DUF1202 family)